MNELETAKILATALKLSESQTKKEVQKLREDLTFHSDQLRQKLETIQLTEGAQGSIGPRGYIGQTGSRGVQGEQGILGEQGLQGEQGILGEQGLQGEQGAQGDQGIQGIQGEQGVQGEQGFTGEQGRQGERGERGIKGDQGKTGPRGERGISGNNGLIGKNGIAGKDGIDGKDGTAGKDGIDGRDGKDGTAGKNGIDGIDGPRGDKGDPGSDANVAPLEKKFDQLTKTVDTKLSKIAYGAAMGTSAGSGEVNLRNLDDVDYNSVSAPTDGHSLIYNGTLGKWQANSGGSGGLSNTFTTTVATRTLIPTSNITFNLGSTTKRYKDIFLANSTIHLGSAQISATGNKILFNNEAAVANSYLQTTFATKATERAALANTNSFIKLQLANTNSFISTKTSTTTFNSALANTNTFIATKLNTTTFNSALANTNLAITNVKTGLTSTNTAIRLLISDRMQVANVISYVGTQITNLIDGAPGALNTLNELAAALNSDASFSTTVTNSLASKVASSTFNSALANTNTFIATKVNTTTFNSALANTNTFIATKTSTTTFNSALANTNSFIKAQLANTNLRVNLINTNLTGTNTAIRTLLSDRLQVANAVAIYQTKTVERAALANTNSFIKLQLANTNTFIATKTSTTTFNSALANTNTFIATKATGEITARAANTISVTTVASSVKLNDAVVVNPAGHLTIVISGITYKIPYFS